jgi:hypothetical protein
LTLAAHEQRDIEVPVAAAANFGVSFMANPSVSVSLVDDRGVVVKTNLAGSELAGSLFRTLYFNKPVSAGRWKIRIENTSDHDQTFLAITWSIGEGMKPPVA